MPDLARIASLLEGAGLQPPQQDTQQRFDEISRMQFETARKPIGFHRLTDEGDAIIIPSYDWHIGNKSCNLDKILAFRDLILETPQCYTIIGGDLLESATKTSVGLGTYDETMSAGKQLRLVARILKPLAEAGKILGAVCGNHEMRIANFCGLEPIEQISDELDIPYYQYQGYLVLQVGQQSYDVYFHHGVGAGCTPMGTLAAARAPGRFIDADAYITGHTHAKRNDSEIHLYLDRSTGFVEERIVHYIAAGSYVEYFGGYPEMKVLQPSPTGTVMMRLKDGPRKEIIVDRGPF